jgi:hypothetical protein
MIAGDPKARAVEQNPLYDVSITEPLRAPGRHFDKPVPSLSKDSG